MKSSKLIISIVFSSLILFTSAFAQGVPVRVTVPFDFTVGDQIMPAGHYQVAIVHDSVLQVVRVDGSSMATALTTHINSGPNPDQTPRLVFRRYGDRRFLAEVWIGSVQTGHELFASSAEMTYAGSLKQDQTIALSASPAK
jgi:hypothetical protein